MASSLAALFATSGTATAAAAGTTAATGSGFSIPQLLSGSLTALNAFSSVQSGLAEQSQAASQALFSDFQSKQELLKGRKETLEQTKQLNKILARNITAGFASGLTGQGSVAGASEQAIREGEDQISITRDQAKIRSRTKQFQASQQRRSGRSFFTTGAVTAASRIGGFVTRELER